MDPNVALILGALVAGVADTATQAVKDGYAALKGLLGRKFVGHPKAEQALADHEEDPDTYEKPLAKQLEATGAADEPAVTAAAIQVIQTAQTAGIHVKYQNIISGGRQAIGDNAIYNEHPSTSA